MPCALPETFDGAQVDGYEAKEHPVHCLLPHEIIHSLADRPLAFRSLLLGNRDDKSRSAFWEHVAQLPPWSSHRVFREELPTERLIPLTIHGDGAEMYSDDEYFVWSISSAFASKGLITDILLFKFPVLIIPERWMRSERAPCPT